MSPAPEDFTPDPELTALVDAARRAVGLFTALGLELVDLRTALEPYE